ncbi:hypothetical protein FP435_03105 [Lactobacillus sp. PV037]|uniref:hypothetical protein n=1 Tax=unclassified Lactobacillus TaxID=2620435 RepID=UPI0022408D87|nr:MULTISPECIES: hypothetical protein [unclassified Lactobacillus]QNQ82386.1 hypothetical protein FP433_04720 [Lactobacillus sp. PV012]QNQ83500.1 hypothetical protein FP435_03105 [Lactobacillus sp. PV037]
MSALWIYLIIGYVGIGISLIYTAKISKYKRKEIVFGKFTKTIVTIYIIPVLLKLISIGENFQFSQTFPLIAEIGLAICLLGAVTKLEESSVENLLIPCNYLVISGDDIEVYSKRIEKVVSKKEVRMPVTDQMIWLKVGENQKKIYFRLEGTGIIFSPTIIKDKQNEGTYIVKPAELIQFSKEKNMFPYFELVIEK